MTTQCKLHLFGESHGKVGGLMARLNLTGVGHTGEVSVGCGSVCAVTGREEGAMQCGGRVVRHSCAAVVVKGESCH